jgi:hypothetical protein
MEHDGLTLTTRSIPTAPRSSFFGQENGPDNTDYCEFDIGIRAIFKSGYWQVTEKSLTLVEVVELKL